MGSALDLESKGCWFVPSAPLFFFQQCSPVGIAIFTGEDPQSEYMKRDESNRVYWFQTRFLSLVFCRLFLSQRSSFKPKMYKGLYQLQ